MQSHQEKKIPKEKTCPECEKHLKDGFFSFDSDINLLCGFCGKVVFSTSEKSSLNHFVKNEKKSTI